MKDFSEPIRLLTSENVPVVFITPHGGLPGTAVGSRVIIDGKDADLRLGGTGSNGDLILYPPGIQNQSIQEGTIHLSGQNGVISIRPETPGSTVGDITVRIDASGGLGLKSPNSRIALRTRSPNAPAGGWIRLEAEEKEEPYTGGDLPPGTMYTPLKSRIVLMGNITTADSPFPHVAETIVIDGMAGDIVLKNADCAEEFDVAQNGTIDPGTVVIIEDGVLHPSTLAYDKRVAGVISGAGGLKAGITLDRKDSAKKRMPVALLGKTFCKVDADYASIEAGDLLTTSATPGHAMKAADPFKAFGSVIGKALRPLKEGTGLIPTLIALQ